MRCSCLLAGGLGLLLSVGTVSGQFYCTLGVAPPGTPYNPYLDQPPSQRAYGELQLIYEQLCPTGCGIYKMISNPTVPNAFAMAVGPLQTKIGYNPGFMNEVLVRFGPGATIGIIAHEFGHHIDFHSTPAWMNNSWSRELKADAWAGCALARVGIPTSQMENALRAIASYPSFSHPGWPQRLQAFRSGYVSCDGSWSKQFESAY